MSQFGFLPAGGSGNLALRRYAFEDAGGFAEEMMTGEDIDLCWRLQLRGNRYVVNEDAVVASVTNAALRRSTAGSPRTAGAVRFSTVGTEPTDSGAI